MTTSLPPADAAAHVVVDDVDDPAPDTDAWHHLVRVRRLRAGDRCTVTDGRGRWRWCVLGDGETIAPDGDVVAPERPTPPITVAFALTKGDKPELVVQKLTELGVDRIVPFRAARSVVRWDGAKASTHRRRWLAIARGAIEQSRGCWLPEIDPVGDVAGLAASGAARLDRGGRPPSLLRPMVAVGPEGGWTEDERDLLPETVALGPNVLRAETAALTAGGVLVALRSELVGERPENLT